MKLAFITISILLYSCASAQSDFHNRENKMVGQCRAGTTLFAQLMYEAAGADTLYTLTMQNRRSRNPEQECSISFPGNTALLNQLYGTLKKVIHMRNKRRKEYTTTIVLSGKLVVLAASSVMGDACVEIVLPQGSNAFTEWQIDKVFGKI